MLHCMGCCTCIYLPFVFDKRAYIPLGNPVVVKNVYNLVFTIVEPPYQNRLR